MNKEGVYYRMAGKITHAGCECLKAPKFEIERIVIARIDFKDSIQVNGQKKENVFEATFAPNPYTNLPFILNSTNAKRIAKMFWDTPVQDGTPCEGRINLLENIPVRLCRELTRDPSDGGQVYGLRISKIPAAEAPAAPAKPKQEKKVITEDKVDTIINWARENGQTIDDIAAKCDFASETVKNAIADALSAPEDDLPE